MSENQKFSSGECIGPLYAFYDKLAESNDGWQWFHRELKRDQILAIYHELLRKIGSEPKDEKGFMFIEDWFVAFQFFSSGSDDRQRDHWVLLLAVLPGTWKSLDAWKVVDGPVFQHVAVNHESLPEALSEFDYLPDVVKITYEGGKIEMLPLDKGRGYIEEIEKRGAVDVVLYFERSNLVTIVTQAKIDLGV